MTDAKERLAARGRPTLDYPVYLETYNEFQKQLNDAELKLHLAGKLKDAKKRGVQVRSAQASVNKLKAEEHKHHIVLKFRALHPNDYEELHAANPPDDAAKKKNPEADFSSTFPDKLTAECSVEPKFTYEEFVEEYQEYLSPAERNDLVVQVLTLNIRAPESEAPKDWSAILSSVLS